MRHVSNWRKNDLEDLVEGLNDFKISKWLAFVPHPYTKKDAKQWIDYCIKNASGKEHVVLYHFVIELKSEKKVIGGLSLEKINKFQGTTGGGIWLNANYHGFGYGTEAYGEKIRFAFQKLKLRRLENGFLKGNLSSFKM